MRKIAPGFLVTGSALLLAALLLFVYFITYRPAQQQPEFEAQIENPATVPTSAGDQETVKVQTIKVAQPSKSPKRQFHHTPSVPQTADATPQAVEKKPGVFRRFLNFIKRLFGGRRKTGGGNSAPFLRGIQSSPSTVLRACSSGTTSVSCEPSKSEVVQLTAVVSDDDKNRLRYEWSGNGGRITGNGYSVTWDLSGLAPGTYTAMLSAYSGTTRIDGTVSVPVSDCADCRSPVLCPKASVDGPDHVAEGQPITFVASVASAVPGITYEWTVSDGKIINGAGTSTIDVDSGGVGGGSITATVSLGGVTPSCGGTTASFTTAVRVPADPRVLMQYEDISVNDERARLDKLAIELRNNPDSKAAIVFHGICPDERKIRETQIRDYLVSKGIPSSFIYIGNGRCSEKKSTEVWVVPDRAPFPNVFSLSPCQCEVVGVGNVEIHRPRATLTGRVKTKDGALVDATVTLIGANKFRKAVKTNSDGVFEFKDLPPGTYNLEITATGLGTRRVEDLQVREGVNLLPEPIHVSERAFTTRFKLRDVIRIGYPDRFLESPAGEITFDWNRELRESEVVTAQTNTDGKISIVDRPPPVPGGTPDVPVTQAHGSQYTAFARVTLIADGLTVISSPAETEQSLAPSHVSWSWKVKPVDMKAAIVSFRFHIDLVWRGEGLKEQTDSYDWPTTFIAKVGPPTSVTAAKYGAPTFALVGLATLGFSLRKRKLLGDLPDEEDASPPIPASPARPASAPVAPDEVAEDVSSSVFAPRRAARGEGFVVQVFAHLPEEDPMALKDRATEAEPKAERVGGDLLDQQIKRGTTLTFTLSMKGLEIDEPQQSRVWRGRTMGVQFGVTVPNDFKPGSMFGMVVVSADTIPIGHFRFAFEVVESGGQRAETPDYVGALTRYQHAFISYAHQDRAEVLKRVQMLNLMKAKFFQDFITLEPGQQWETGIREAIDRSDVIFLFWSKAASASIEVKKEILYALARRAGDENAAPAIHPVVIEGPPPPAPPADLTFLHFDDKFSYWIFAAESAQE